MLKRLKAPSQEGLAESAAREVAPYNGVGAYISSTPEAPGLTSYQFECRMRGYKGWIWNVIIFQGKKTDIATVSEVVLIPGEDAIIAPDWVPWSDRTGSPEETLEVSVVLNSEETINSENDTNHTRAREPLAVRLRKLRAKKQNSKKS